LRQLALTENRHMKSNRQEHISTIHEDKTQQRSLQIDFNSSQGPYLLTNFKFPMYLSFFLPKTKSLAELIMRFRLIARGHNPLAEPV